MSKILTVIVMLILNVGSSISFADMTAADVSKALGDVSKSLSQVQASKASKLSPADQARLVQIQQQLAGLNQVFSPGIPQECKSGQFYVGDDSDSQKMRQAFQWCFRCGFASCTQVTQVQNDKTLVLFKGAF